MIRILHHSISSCYDTIILRYNTKNAGYVKRPGWCLNKGIII